MLSNLSYNCPSMRMLCIFAALFFLQVVPVACFAVESAQQAPRLIQTILLPGVKGRIDHLAVDISGQRLFIAALGNDTVEIVDLKQGKVSGSIGGVKKPQG